MIAFLLAAAATSSGPVLYTAEARSIAYRDSIAADRGRRPAATVAQIGRTACAHERSRLVAGVRDNVGFGWAETARTDAQAHRLRAQLRLEAEAQVAAFEGRLQQWLERKIG